MMNDVELKRIIYRLSFDLLDARLEQITDGENRLQLAFKRYSDEEGERRRFFLIIDFDPAHLDIYPTTHPKKAPPVPQAFTMLLRKYIANRMLTGLVMADDDRIVTFEFGWEDETQHELIVELTGRAPHVFFVETATRKILGCIGHDERRQVHDIYVRPESIQTKKAGQDRFAGISSEAMYTELDGYFSARDEKERVEACKSEALKRLKKSHGRASKLVESLTKEFYRAEAAELERVEADLLNAYAYQLKQGLTMVTLPDFETGAPVNIQLDPSISIRESIDRRYHRAKRLLRSREQIETRLETVKKRKLALEALIQTVTAANDTSQVIEISAEIDMACAPDERHRRIQTGQKVQFKDRIKNPTVHLPYKTFLSSDGTKILVGKSAKDNDELTLRHARGNDYWLHVSGAAGSHVIVKHASPNHETLLDAALLAMHYSKLAKSGSAEVHVTQVKYVRKPKGAPAGQVEIRGEKSIVAKASEKRLERLMKTESS